MSILRAFAAFAAFTLLSGTLCAEDVLIETRPEGKNFDRYKEVSGSWLSSSQAPFSKSTAPGLSDTKIGSRKVIVPVRDPAVARFSPKFKADQRAFVYVTWPKAANATNVKYKVKHAGGEEVKTLTQTGWGQLEPSNANQWVLLGSYDFKAGDDSYVEVTIGTDSQKSDQANNPQAYTDAVLFADKAVANTGGAPEVISSGAAKAAAPPTPPDIVVESRPEGKNNQNYKEPYGKWLNSGDGEHGKSKAPDLTEAKKCGTRKVLCSNKKVDENAHDEPAAAQFMINIPAKAHYYVYVTWPREANAAPVHYYIKYAGGDTTKTLVQDGWGVQQTGGIKDVWVSLGDYDFNPGPDQYVQATKGPDTKVVDERNICQVYADAVRFMLKPLEEPSKETSKPSDVSAPGKAAETPMPAVGPLEWLTDLNDALKVAKEKNKKIFIFFSAEESAGSQYYMNRVFTSPEVNSVLRSNYVLLKLDMQQHSDIAYRLHIFKAGSIVVYSSDGQSALKKITERLTPGELATELKD